MPWPASGLQDNQRPCCFALPLVRWPDRSRWYVPHAFGCPGHPKLVAATKAAYEYQKACELAAHRLIMAR